MLPASAVADPVGGGKDRLRCRAHAVLIIAEAHQGDAVGFALDYKLRGLWTTVQQIPLRQPGGCVGIVGAGQRDGGQRRVRRSGAAPPRPGHGGHTVPRASAGVPTGWGGSAAAPARAGRAWQWSPSAAGVRKSVGSGTLPSGSSAIVRPWSASTMLPRAMLTSSMNCWPCSASVRAEIHTGKGRASAAAQAISVTSSGSSVGGVANRPPSGSCVNGHTGQAHGMAMRRVGIVRAPGTAARALLQTPARPRHANPGNAPARWRAWRPWAGSTRVPPRCRRAGHCAPANSATGCMVSKTSGRLARAAS